MSSSDIGDSGPGVGAGWGDFRLNCIAFIVWFPRGLVVDPSVVQLLQWPPALLAAVLQLPAALLAAVLQLPAVLQLFDAAAAAGDGRNVG